MEQAPKSSGIRFFESGAVALFRFPKLWVYRAVTIGPLPYLAGDKHFSVLLVDAYRQRKIACDTKVLNGEIKVVDGPKNACFGR